MNGNAKKYCLPLDLFRQVCVPWARRPEIHLANITAVTGSASQYSALIPVRRECICSIQRALKCARRAFKLYIFTEVYDDIYSSVCEDVAQRKSMNECSEVK